MDSQELFLHQFPKRRQQHLPLLPQQLSQMKSQLWLAIDLNPLRSLSLSIDQKREGANKIRRMMGVQREIDGHLQLFEVGEIMLAEGKTTHMQLFEYNYRYRTELLNF